MSSKSSSIASKAFLALAGGCFVFGAGVTVCDVALRALAESNIPGAIELTSLSIGLGALVSMPVCYARRAHVTAKLLSELSPRRFTRPLSLLNAAASVVFGAMLFWIMADNALSKLGSPETTADLGLPIPAALAVVAIVLGSGALASAYAFWVTLRQQGYS